MLSVSGVELRGRGFQFTAGSTSSPLSTALRSSSASNLSATSPSSRALTDVAPLGGTPMQPIPAFSFSGSHAVPHVELQPVQTHWQHAPRLISGIAVSASPAAKAESATPFLSSSAAQSWSPERRQRGMEANMPQVLAPAAASSDVAYSRAPAHSFKSSDAAQEYASVSREVNQALAAHYGQQPTALRSLQTNVQQEHVSHGHDTPAAAGAQDNSTAAARALDGQEDARQYSPVVPPPLPLQPQDPTLESPPRTTYVCPGLFFILHLWRLLSSQASGCWQLGDAGGA